MSLDDEVMKAMETRKLHTGRSKLGFEIEVFSDVK